MCTKNVPSLFQALCYPTIVPGLLALILLTGCQTNEPASASFASVKIQNRTVEEIAASTLQVFGQDGYKGGMTGSGEMVFEKEASRGTSFAREGIAGGFYGATTINRVRVQIVPLAGGVTRLQCKAYMVTGGSDTFFQEEVPLTNIRGRPYQNLLDKVARQLK